MNEITTNIESEYRRNNTPPKKGISLGGRLAISTVFIVSVIMGTISYVQFNMTLSNQQKMWEHLLVESLAPLASRLESARSIDKLQSDVNQFHQAYMDKGHSGHDVVVLNKNKEVLVSTLANNKLDDKNVLTASVSINLSLLNQERGTLTVYKDAGDYHQSIKKQWFFWIIHMATNLGTIFLFLYLAIHFLVRKPIDNLVKKIKKMEMGYWDQDSEVQDVHGSWEFRWLEWRFCNMVNEVRIAVNNLLEAERKAQKCLQSLVNNQSNLPSASIQLQTPGSDLDNSVYYEHLLNKCRKLEKVSQVDYNAVALATEVIKNDVVEANRLGYRQIKNRLENAAFSILEPKLFHSISQQLLVIKKSQHTWVATNAKELCRALEKNMIPCIDVSHRVKHIAGILAKMKNKRLRLQEIHDLYAFRVIVPTESDCYSALGAIHQKFSPDIGRFKDYIVRPKTNGYQSLHTCVSNKDGPLFEVQIRSVTMHQQAARGNAAHWLYKKEESNKSTRRKAFTR